MVYGDPDHPKKAQSNPIRQVKPFQDPLVEDNITKSSGPVDSEDFITI